MKRTHKSATALAIIVSALLFAPPCAAADNGSWYRTACEVLSSIITCGTIAILGGELAFINELTVKSTREQAPRSDEEFERFLQAMYQTTKEISPEVEAWILAQQPNALKGTRIVPLVSNHLGINAGALMPPLYILKKFPQANRLAAIRFSSDMHHVIKEHVAQANQDQANENENTEIVRAVFQHEFAHVLHKHTFAREARLYGPYFHAYLSALTFLCSDKHSALTSLAMLTGIKIGLPMLELFLRRRAEEQADDSIQTEQGGRALFTTFIENHNAWAAHLSQASGGALSQELCRQLVDLQDLEHPTPEARLARLDARFAKQKAEARLREVQEATFTQVRPGIYVPKGFYLPTEKSHSDPERELC